jgi:D-serine deaminase-like pyridoxal phosphate-dependent protein
MAGHTASPCDAVRDPVKWRRMTLPRLTIDLDAVADATRRLAAYLSARAMTLAGVTKCVDGEPLVGRTRASPTAAFPHWCGSLSRRSAH